MATPWLQEWPCPVCGERTWTDADRTGTAIDESTDWCQAGCYRGYSGLGLHDERIGPHSWEWSWRDDEDPVRYGTRQGERAVALLEGKGIDRNLLRACHAAPADAAPRLILADWCDERGLPNWAAFWREAAARIAPERGAAGRAGTG